MEQNRHNDKKMNEVMSELIDQLNFKEKIYDSKIKSAWEELMGPVISKYTYKVFINKKALFIKISSTALKQELFNQREEIMEKVNQHLGESFIERVVVR